MKTGEPVAAARCNSYDNCAGSIRRVLELSGLLADLRGRRVLLKLNMMKGTPETAEATDARFAGALVRVLTGEGCVVSAGDSSGILGFTSEVFDASGMTAEVTANGGIMVNFDAGPFFDVDLGGRFAGRRLPVARALLEAEAVLDVPKMKTHTFLGLTLAVKNLVGVFPGAVKCGLHTLAPDRDEFAQLVAGIPAALESAGVNMAGAIVDGVLALGGRGGTVRPAPTWMNFTAAGRNLFDLDMFCATLGGFDPAEVPLCRIGARSGLGAADVTGLTVVGDPIEPVPIPHPGLDFKEAAPPVTAAYYRVRGNLVKPVHDPLKCSGCDKCVQVCPVGCILVRGPAQREITGDCNRCLACREVCPTGAMGLVANPVLKPILKRRARGLRMDRLR